MPERTQAREASWVGCRASRVGAPVGDSRRLAETQHWGGTPSAGEPKGVAIADVDTKRAARFMLWIDAVGGYLVCLGDEIVIGQAAPGTKVDVPIQADISRKH